MVSPGSTRRPFTTEHTETTEASLGRKTRTASVEEGMRWRVLLILTCVVVRSGAVLFAQSTPLGDSGTFAILGGAAVTNRGATRVAGNVGVNPGNVISGFPPGSLTVGD